jgi:predicted transcriptional regulator
MTATKGMSKPLEVMALRLSEDERRTLQRIAKQRRVTMSYVLREGLRMYAQEIGVSADALRDAGVVRAP